jgi:hypothetical protein
MTSGAVRKHKDKKDRKLYEKKPKKKKKINKSDHEEVNSNSFDVIWLLSPLQYLTYE